MVCNLVTYRARSAVREVGYALGFPRPLVDRVAKALETYDCVMVRRDLEAEGGFAEFFTPDPSRRRWLGRRRRRRRSVGRATRLPRWDGPAQRRPRVVLARSTGPVETIRPGSPARPTMRAARAIRRLRVRWLSRPDGEGRRRAAHVRLRPIRALQRPPRRVDRRGAATTTAHPPCAADRNGPVIPALFGTSALTGDAPGGPRRLLVIRSDRASRSRSGRARSRGGRGRTEPGRSFGAVRYR